jgi:hypothetical protein
LLQGEFSSHYFEGMKHTLGKLYAFFLQNAANRARFGASCVKCERDLSVTFAASARAGGGGLLRCRTLKKFNGILPLTVKITTEMKHQKYSFSVLTPCTMSCHYRILVSTMWRVTKKRSDALRVNLITGILQKINPKNPPHCKDRPVRPS